MSTLAKNTKATVIPCLRYRNAPAAIEWFCATFGFVKQAVYPNPDCDAAMALQYQVPIGFARSFHVFPKQQTLRSDS
jgi:uncharacterized glyoxalase superfamily protein PhnB